MIKKIIILEQAELDLKELKEYIITHFSQEVWKKIYRNINRAINDLKKNPLIGKPLLQLNELTEIEHRQIILGNNRIIYEIEDNIIYIDAILDGRRDMASLLTKRLLRSH